MSKSGRMEGAVACICRDSTRNLLDGVVRTVTASSAFMVEAQALFEALNQFLSLRKEEVVFETDSSNLRQKYYSIRSRWPWPLKDEESDKMNKFLVQSVDPNIWVHMLILAEASHQLQLCKTSSHHHHCI